ncbi:MAG: MFS transporter, partial [Dehalococcoidia bacterium]|nr:MFS transporter [Dehalococcoidia bacterium]
MNENVVRLSRWEMFLAYLAGSFGFAPAIMASILVPLRAEELGAPIILIGVIVASGALAPAILGVWSGSLSDQLGSKFTYTLGTALAGVAALASAVSPDYWLLMACQMLFGLARTGSWTASQSYITSVGTVAERPAIAGRFGLSANLGALIAPVLLGVAAEIVGYQAAFLFIAATCFGYTVVGVALRDIKVPSRSAGSAFKSTAGFTAAF